jgi:hypothetical protein
MMNSSSEIVKEMSSDEMIPRHHERQRDEPERGPLRLAKVVGRLLERGIEVREGRVQDRDAEGRADQRMRRDHRPLCASGRPKTCTITTRSDTATMISGSTSGSMMSPMIPVLPGKL